MIVGIEKVKELKLGQFNKQDTLILVALESELPKENIPQWNVQYIGVGKVNAALAVCRFNQKFKPKVILNFGTAGSLRDDLTGLVEATSFFSVIWMHGQWGLKPFEDDTCIAFGRDGVSCGSGDSFVTSEPELMTDIVDMEAFALAKFAVQTDVDFHCFKYISDGADSEAADSWKENVINSSELFIKEVLE